MLLEENVCIICMTQEGFSLSLSGRMSHKMVSSWKTICWQIYLSTPTHFKQLTSLSVAFLAICVTQEISNMYRCSLLSFLCQEVPYHTDFCLLDSYLLLSWISYFSAVFLTYFNSSIYHTNYFMFVKLDRNEYQRKLLYSDIKFTFKALFINLTLN